MLQEMNKKLTFLNSLYMYNKHKIEARARSYVFN